MLVGWEPSLTNLHASLINDPHHHHINHQTVYIVATGCLKTLKMFTPEIQKLLPLSQLHQRQISYCPSLKLGRKNINVVMFTTSSSKIFISVQSILNRLTSALVNNVEGKIMVLWGLNDCVTSLRHHNDVRSLTTNSIIDQHYFSSVSFRVLILDNNEVMHGIFLLQLYSMVIFIVEISIRYITLIWYWMYIIFPLCFSSILRN